MKHQEEILKMLKEPDVHVSKISGLYITWGYLKEEDMNILLLVLDAVMYIFATAFTLWYAGWLSQIFNFSERLTKINKIAAIMVLFLCIIWI